MASQPTDGAGRRDAASQARAETAETVDARGGAAAAGAVDVGVVETVPSGEDPSVAGAILAGPPLAFGELSKGTVVGDYVVEGKLGEGGMGRVYSAIHPVIGKRAAIKVLRPEMCARPELVSRFVKEARAVNQIGHPNIVDIFAFGEMSDGHSYLVMERLDGESLAARLRRDRPPLDEACRILVEIVTALEAAHEQRIIHRDLKPDNVYLCATRVGPPRIKLLDFGIAKLLDDVAEGTERTLTGNLMGTPQYIAPEQARGYAIDGAVDVYSLGVMAFEMITGRRPFIADNAMDMVSKHLHDPPPSPASLAPGLPPALVALVLAMLAKEPGDRPSLTQVHAVLADAQATARGMLPIEAQLASTIPDTSRPRPLVVARRRRRGWMVAVLLIGGGAVAAAVVASRGGSAVRAPVVAVMDGAGPEAVIVDAGIAGIATVDAGPPSGTVRIDIEDGLASVAIDGVVVARDRRSVELELPAGDHRLEVTAPRRRAHVARLQVVAGRQLIVPVALVREGRSGAAGDRPGSGTGNAPAPPPAGSGSGSGSGARPEDDGEGTISPFGSKPRQPPADKPQGSE